jgi:hypothetical protein
MNDGRVCLHDDRPSMPTTMESFIRASFVPRYREESTRRSDGPETFIDWMARDELAAN